MQPKGHHITFNTMKKEKQVKTYQRKTKSGKTTTVKAHTAKYDAADMAKEALKKAGAGKEFEKKKANKIDVSSEISPEDFKAWYHWDTDDDPKNEGALKAEKQLKKKLGTKGYKEFFDKATDSYSARGHNKAFKEVCSEKGSKVDAKTPKTEKSSNKPKGAKGRVTDEDRKEQAEFEANYNKPQKSMGKSAKADGDMSKVKDSSGKTPSTSKLKKGASTSNKETEILEEFSVKDSIKAAKRLKKSYKQDADFVRNGDIYIGGEFKGGKAKPEGFEKHVRKLDKAIELLNKGKHAQAGNILREYLPFNSKKDMNKDSNYSSMSEELLKKEAKKKPAKVKKPDTSKTEKSKAPKVDTKAKPTKVSPKKSPTKGASKKYSSKNRPKTGKPFDDFN